MTDSRQQAIDLMIEVIRGTGVQATDEEIRDAATKLVDAARNRRGQASGNLRTHAARLGG